MGSISDNILKKLGLFIPLMIGLIIDFTNANSQVTINTIDVKNTDEIIDFFRFSTTRSPLISAHRGGERIGYPENCLETLENTLQHTHAMFEIDPRITKDGVVVLMHDKTLDRTTTGTGRVKDYTWEELKKLNLKDSKGSVTAYHIPLLEDVIEWAKGKTILVLDDKNVPYPLVAELVRKHDAFNNILMTVRDAGIAKQFYKLDERFMFEAYVFDMEDITEYEKAGIPWSHIMAYIGSKDVSENIILFEELNERGVKCMVSGAPSLDKEFLQGKLDTYKNIFNRGADIIETDIPLKVAEQISPLIKSRGCIEKYFGQKEIK